MRARIAGWLITTAMVLTTAVTRAEVAVVQSPHGSRVTITDLGNGIGMQSDPHGQGGAVVMPPEPTIPLPPGPHGDQNQRAVTPFGSPSPPNQLTPAPVLPFHPNRPMMPSPSSPPTAAPHSNSGGGRLGR